MSRLHCCDLTCCSDYMAWHHHQTARPVAFPIGNARGFTSRSMVLPPASSATWRSYSACRTSQSRGSPPKYRASLSAVSPVMPRRFKRMSLIRGGFTLSSFASAVALSSQGSMKAWRKTSPGCGGGAVLLLIGERTFSDSVTRWTPVDNIAQYRITVSGMGLAAIF
jgi:hypothetical protein